MIYNIKKDLRRLWDDTCSIYVYEKTTNESTKRTEFGETMIYQDIPCKLSFEALNTVNQVFHADDKSQNVKLFLDNELEIPTGSKVVVMRGENSFTYKVGSIGMFCSHQELRLTTFDRWA